MNALKPFWGAAALTALIAAPAFAGVDKDLPLPQGEPSAEEIAKQVYFVNHFYAAKNYSIEKKGKTITVLLSRSKGKKPKTNTLVRYLNNDYSDGTVKAKDLAIFKSGKLRGTGMLVTDFVDDATSQSYSIWLPALRKVRRFAQPAHDDSWGGTDFTFGDVTLRKPFHETHELLGKETFGQCLKVMDVPKKQRKKYTKVLPEAACDHKEKEVYKLKSTTKFQNWWYDHRISYVDAKTFADYRTDYFKDGKKIKVIDRHWTTMGLDDPRGAVWGYWYGHNLVTGHETLAYMPTEISFWNTDKKASLWTEKTLRKIKR